VGHSDIATAELRLGRDVTIEPGGHIGGILGDAQKVVIGDNVFIGNDVRILAPEVYIGDYTVIHNHTTIYGYSPVRIGDCCWIGQNSIVNCTAPVWIGDGVTISAYSNLWTHFRAGDILQGCRFSNEKPLIVGDDVWIGVQCSVAPVTIHKRALILAGSIVTRDIEENRVYGGNTARDLTEKMGPQFEEVSLEEKFAMLKDKLIDFDARWGEGQMSYRADSGESDVFAGALGAPQSGLRIGGGNAEDEFYAAGILVTARPWHEGVASVFSVADRTYSKLRTPQEIAFMRYLLPQVKFFPHTRKGFAELRKHFEELIPALAGA
jgi:acetyltransferase-like isoleucine patch superfamily enzyme